MKLYAQNCFEQGEQFYQEQINENEELISKLRYINKAYRIYNK